MTILTAASAQLAIRNNGQDLVISKPNPSVGVALIPQSAWLGAGFPGGVAGTYGAVGKANGRVLTSASVGAVPYQNAPGGSQMYVMKVGASAGASVNAMGTVYLVDRVADCLIDGLEAVGAFTGLTATSRLPAASANAEGCQIFVYVTGALAAGSNTLTFTYTNQAGTGSRVTQNMVTVASAIVNRSVNANLFVGLQAGDTGVRSIDSIASNTAIASGTICVALVRILARVSVPLILTPFERDFVAQCPGWKPIYDSTCFDYILVGAGAIPASNVLTGSILLASG